MGFLVIFFRFKCVLSTCIWQFTNRKKLLCLTVMVKTQTTTQAALSCFAIRKQFISPSGQHLKSLYGFTVWIVISLFLCFFWLPHEPPENNKKFGFALVLIMKLFSKKVQVTLIINCTPSFQPSGSSYFNCLRHNILSVLLGRDRGVSRIRKPNWFIWRLRATNTAEGFVQVNT